MAFQYMQDSAQAEGLVRHDRPWLLPQNRKLRNLVSISLRNLAFSLTFSGRSRGQTIDDDALPNTRQSPAKTVALREQKPLGHSLSSSDLRSVAEHDAFNTEPKKSSKDEGTPMKENSRDKAGPRTPQRPHLSRRRRSTLDWANASPLKRQQKLENLTAERVADVFFSLHVSGIREPIYISEIAERTMNPTFGGIQLSSCGPGITRSDSLEVRVWARVSPSDSWKQLFELPLDLKNLHYLGRNLDQCQHPFPLNSVVFHLTDGVYVNFLSRPEYSAPPTSGLNRSTTSRTLPTSSFDALLRLAKLDDSIQDALATRDKLAEDLESIIESHKQAFAEHDLVSEAEDRLKTIDFAKKTVEKQLEKARRQQEERKDSIRRRRDCMAADSQMREVAASAMRKAIPLLPASRHEHGSTEKAIRNQRRRICENLQECYPIQPLPKQALAFTIRNLHLPNSESLDSEQPETISAALGHVAHALQLLSFYLNRPLTYPVVPKSSTSTIYDPVSMLKTSSSLTAVLTSSQSDRALRTYPLFPKGVPRFRFEYAVFLLNKNIQVLLEEAYNVRVLDIRHTLPNLKYLLYVATAGEGELPARKAGGVRGLLNTGVNPPLERAGSHDSQSSGLSGLLWHGGGVGAGQNGKAKGGSAAENLKKTIRGLDGKVGK